MSDHGLMRTVQRLAVNHDPAGDSGADRQINSHSEVD